MDFGNGGGTCVNVRTGSSCCRQCNKLHESFHNPTEDKSISRRTPEQKALARAQSLQSSTSTPFYKIFFIFPFQIFFFVLIYLVSGQQLVVRLNGIPLSQSPIEQLESLESPYMFVQDRLHVCDLGTFQAMVTLTVSHLSPEGFFVK